MRKKIDSIYELAFRTYVLAMFNKQLGLEKKSNMVLAAEYALERQLGELSKQLGTNDLLHIWESNKHDDIEERAKKILDYIISTYDGIVNEIVDTANIGAIDIDAKTSKGGSGAKEINLDEHIGNEGDVDNVDLEAISNFLNLG
jgi:hypothetical protein